MLMSIASTGLGHDEMPRLGRRTYTVDEVAALLGLSRNSAYVAARADKLPVPVIRVGKELWSAARLSTGFSIPASWGTQPDDAAP